MARDPVCIACSQPTGPGPRLNRLPDGRVCPSCRERLLDTLPPILPAESEELSFEEWAEDGDDPGDDFLKGA
ncbi:MAG TPA: hypothetical protein VF414_06800 [Thermoanaerobaculia bacterium]